MLERSSEGFRGPDLLLGDIGQLDKDLVVPFWSCSDQEGDMPEWPWA